MGTRGKLTCNWRDASLGGLKEQDRAYRIAFESAHITGQRACLLADLAVSAVPASALTERIVRVPPRHGLPPLPTYALGLLTTAQTTPPIEAAKDHLRACFEKAA